MLGLFGEGHNHLLQLEDCVQEAFFFLIPHAALSIPSGNFSIPNRAQPDPRLIVSAAAAVGFRPIEDMLHLGFEVITDKHSTRRRESQDKC